MLKTINELDDGDPSKPSALSTLLPRPIAPCARHPPTRFTEVYIEALLVDEELAGQVWDAWDKGEIDDQMAWLRLKRTPSIKRTGTILIDWA